MVEAIAARRSVAQRKGSEFGSQRHSGKVRKVERGGRYNDVMIRCQRCDDGYKVEEWFVI